MCGKVRQDKVIGGKESGMVPVAFGIRQNTHSICHSFFSDEIAVMLKMLVLFDQEEDGLQLQRLFGELLSLIENSIIEVWRPDQTSQGTEPTKQVYY